ncbi:acetylornithine transaminase [Gorillibacterium massiliense]|uniref:acetylornithine transaminase n=1 Tax=Gorillibacterium massiliense TaxID=1280390 RepID=UPI0004B0A96E|nr:acetylornithine transaminase [Gorillibacterium massiliense]
MGEQQSALFPTYARFPITMVKGEGSRLWDDQGNEYLDFMAGLAVTGLGHAPKRVKERLVAQLDELWHTSNLFSTPQAEKVAQLLTANSCGDAVFFCNSGADANEAAIKLARRYNQKVLGNDRYEIITFKQSFHGRTLATLTATGQDKVKEGYLPLPQGFIHAPYNDVAALESYITDKTCAIMLELVQAEGGIIVADPDFVQEITRLCEKYNLLLIIDEVQTGLCRTGKLFAYQHYGIEPDIFTLAKALGSGFPVGAMVGKSKLIPAFTPGSHATTFGGTPIAMSAALATLEVMLADHLADEAARKGKLLVDKLEKALAGNAFVKEIRGTGLIIGIECVEPTADAIAAIHAKRLLVVPAGPMVIRLLPSLIVTDEEIDKAVEIIAGVLAEKEAERKQTAAK